MANYIFKFPDIGEGLTEGVVVEWKVKKGQKIDAGDILVTMETDKVVAEIPSPKAGVVLNLYGKPGDTIKVGQALVELEVEGEVVEETKTEKKHQIVEEEGAGVVGVLEVAGDGAILKAGDEGLTDKQQTQTTKKVLATPVARAMAKEFGIDINKIKGTGPAGRVTKEDIRKYYENQSKAISEQKQEATLHLEKENRLIEIEPISQIRRAIAQNMIRSKHNAAHMALFDDVEISSLIDLRQKYKTQFEKEGVKLTYLPFILKATALALKKHKALNSQMDLDEGKIYYKKYYNIGIAVDTERGLVVPVIRDVDKLSIREIAKQINDLTQRAIENKLTLEDLKDGTFSVTNYGSIGGKYAFPVINYPQVAILGIGAIYKAPIVKNDTIVVGNILPLSMSVDHRVVDGAEVSRFFGTLKDFLENPAAMLMF